MRRSRLVMMRCMFVLVMCWTCVPSRADSAPSSVLEGISGHQVAPVAPEQELELLFPQEVTPAYGGKKPGLEKEDKEKKVPKKVEVTGSNRFRYESKQNFDLIYDRPEVEPNQPDNDDNYLINQLKLNLDLRPTKYIQGHITFLDAREFASHQLDIDALDRTYRNSYQNEADFYEAWVKLKLGESPVWFQAGRMELTYGEKRLLGNSGWSNTGRSFDTLRLMYEKDDVKLDLFAANVVLIDSNGWDHASHHDNLLGAYATVKNLPHGLQDVYLIYRDSDAIPLEEYTAGTRIDGDEGNIDWNFEGVYQWGTSRDMVSPYFSKSLDLDQEAWAAHAEVGYTGKCHPLEPRLAFEYNFATGDEDPYDGKNNSFDQLFPTNHAPFGIIDFFGWKNMHDAVVKVSWKQTKKLELFTEWHAFWLDEEDRDAWYNSSQRVFRNANGADVSSFAGHELDLRAVYKFNGKTEFDIGYCRFFAGQYAADTAVAGAGADDADYVYVQTTWKF